MGKSRDEKEKTIRRLNKQIKMAKIKSYMNKIVGVIKKKF